MTKKKLSVLSDADEAALSKLAKKKRSLAVDGKPDDTDVRNLTVLFELYDKNTGNALRRMVDEIKVEKALTGKREEDVMTAENLSFSMPQDLQEFIERYYPTIWTNKEHLRWFLTKFPMFRR